MFVTRMQMQKICTSGGVYVPCIYAHVNTEEVPLVEFMYLVFTRM